jgi:hypothetical protein
LAPDPAAISGRGPGGCGVVFDQAIEFNEHIMTTTSNGLMRITLFMSSPMGKMIQQVPWKPSIMILYRINASKFLMNYPAASYGVSQCRKQTSRSKLRGIEPGIE